MGANDVLVTQDRPHVDEAASSLIDAVVQRPHIHSVLPFAEKDLAIADPAAHRWRKLHQSTDCILVDLETLRWLEDLLILSRCEKQQWRKIRNTYSNLNHL